MLTGIVLTCLLAAGAKFTPPAGWTVESITASSEGKNTTAICFAVDDGCAKALAAANHGTSITLRRELKPGEPFALPDGCAATSSATVTTTPGAGGAP